MTDLALWPFVLDVHGRPGVEEALHELQDTHGHSVDYLLWALWITASGRVVGDDDLDAAARLSRGWQDAAVAPLRDLRRALKTPSQVAPRHAWEGLRGKVKSLELDAERMLLEMLEAASPPPGNAAADASETLRRAAAIWGGSAPAALLERLASASGV